MLLVGIDPKAKRSNHTGIIHVERQEAAGPSLLSLALLWPPRG